VIEELWEENKMIDDIFVVSSNTSPARLHRRGRYRTGLLIGLAVLLGACTTVDDRIADYRAYCSKAGYAAESEGMRDCVVQLESAYRSRHVHRH